MKSFILLIPVFNEAKRAPKEFFRSLSELDCNRVILINDGSTDDSVGVINSYVPHLQNVEWITNEVNLGKAESIRRGMVKALTEEDTIIITADADGAINVQDISNLVKFHKDNHASNSVVISGARVKLAGSQVNRTRLRHWIGRIIATLVNLVSRIDMYDPQSPLKIWDIDRDTFSIALNSPFRTRWFYDMELLSRIRHLSLTRNIIFGIVELPVHHFQEVSGSNLKKRHVFKVLAELVGLIVGIKKSKGIKK